MEDKITIGIIAAPGLAADITGKMVDDLPESLEEVIDKRLNWRVEKEVDPLTGAAEDTDEIFSNIMDYQQNKKWDFVITLTDLPLYHNKDIVVCDLNSDKKTAVLSLPAFGWVPMKKRVKRSIIQVISILYNDSITKNNAAGNKTYVSDSITKQFPLAPIRYLHMENGHKKFVIIPKVNGHARLLLGMTWANNPFKIMSSLTNLIAIAFTTGAFGMIFTTMWKLSHAFSIYRLAGLFIAAIIGMVLWIIVAHHLWERPSRQEKKSSHHFYNIATVLTLLISITVFYSVLYIIFFVTAVILIPPEFFARVLDLDHAVGLAEYLRVAWLAASISTFASSIGAGLQNEELVREITYGYRQYRRYYEIKK
ncbi:5,10-methylene-tetrahydrofolate dehydrogenase [Virgibacillus sp. W0181]|uniref:5,10-methylene-tetrahydrofolate dehydrogenase n=1 Tax=Virgibacillus sp. W0181 TaxID=3391581 RepID=UPI003F48EC30